MPSMEWISSLAGTVVETEPHLAAELKSRTNPALSRNEANKYLDKSNSQHTFNDQLENHVQRQISKQDRLAKLKLARLHRQKQVLSQPSIDIDNCLEHTSMEPDYLMPLQTALDTLQLSSRMTTDHPQTLISLLQAAHVLTLAHRQKSIDSISSLPVRIHQAISLLAFHIHNASGSKTSYHRNTAHGGLPWLPSNASEATSKHIIATKSNKQQSPSTNMLVLADSCGDKGHGVAISKSTTYRQMRPSPQESKLEIDVLHATILKLRLKRAFSVLRSNARLSKHRNHLVDRIAKNITVCEQQKVLSAWRSMSVPQERLTQAARQHYKTHHEAIVMNSTFSSWRQSAAQSAYHRALLHTCQQEKSKQRLVAVLRYWQGVVRYCELEVMQQAILAGWTHHWSKRKALLIWQHMVQRRRLQLWGLQCGFDTDQSPVAASSSGRGPILHRPLKVLLSKGMTAARQALRGLCECRGMLLEKMAPFSHITELHEEGGDCEERERNDVLSLIADRNKAYDPAAYSGAAAMNGILAKRQRAAYAVVESLAYKVIVCSDNISSIGKDIKDLQTQHAQHEALKTQHEQAIHSVHAEIVRLQSLMRELMVSKGHLDNSIAESDEQCHRAQTECLELKVKLKDCIEKAASLTAAAEAANAAFTSLQDDLHRAKRDISSWKGKVESAAVQLSKCTPSASAAAKIKLKEARNRLDAETHAVQEYQRELPRLYDAACEASQHAEHAEAALLDAQEHAMRALEIHQLSCKRADELKDKGAALEEALFQIQRNLDVAHDAYAVKEEQLLEVQVAMQGIEGSLLTRRQELAILQRQRAVLQDQHASAAERVLEDAAEVEENQEESLFLEKKPSSPAAENWEITSLHLDLTLDSRKSNNGYDVIDSLATTPACTPRCVLSLPPPSEHGNGATDHSDAPDAPSMDLVVRMAPLECRETQSLTLSADAYHCRRLALHAFRAMREHANLWRCMLAMSMLKYSAVHLPPALFAWRDASRDEIEIEVRITQTWQKKRVLVLWQGYARRIKCLREREQEFVVHIERKTLLMCFNTLRSHSKRHVWHRQQLYLAQTSRLRSFFSSWKAWAHTEASLAFRLHLAVCTQERAYLAEFLARWRDNVQKLSLLRRTFARAMALWDSRTGASRYEEEYRLLHRCFLAWSISSHVQREDRRECAMEAAAERHRNRGLLSISLEAFRHAAVTGTVFMYSHNADDANYRDDAKMAHGQESDINCCENHRWLRREAASTLQNAFLTWRLHVICSKDHIAWVAARKYRESVLMKKASHALAMNAAWSVGMAWKEERGKMLKTRRAFRAWRRAIDVGKRWQMLREEAMLMQKRNSPVAACCVSTEGVLGDGEPREVPASIATAVNHHGHQCDHSMMYTGWKIVHHGHETIKAVYAT